MILAYVKGTVVSTNKTSHLTGKKLLIVEEWNPLTGECSNVPKIAIDTVNAGEGECVFCVSGSSARQTDETKNKPVDLAIIGIVDQVDMEGKVLFKKFDNGE